MKATGVDVNTARRRALVAGLGWLGWRADAQVLAPITATTTTTTATTITHRRLRFDIQLHNPGGTPLPPQPLWFCAPLSRTGTQALVSLDSSWPFERHDEWGGHTLLRWMTPALPPHGLRALTLDAVVGLSRAPRAEALEPGAWLQPERFMESDDPAIAALALTLRRDSPRATVVAVYDWVRSELAYAGYVADDLGAAQALRERRGDCTEYAYLVVALCRALGLPARAVGGFVVSHDAAPRSTEYHNWAEVHLEGAWRLVDAQKEALFERLASVDQAGQGIDQASNQASDHIALRLIGDRPLGPLGQAHRFVTHGPAQVRVR